MEHSFFAIILSVFSLVLSIAAFIRSSYLQGRLDERRDNDLFRPKDGKVNPISYDDDFDF